MGATTSLGRAHLFAFDAPNLLISSYRANPRLTALTHIGGHASVTVGSRPAALMFNTHHVVQAIEAES
jgi:hypothetical protein